MCHVGDYACEHVPAKTAKMCYCFRRHAGLTREEVAEALHAGSSTVYYWETGLSPMSREIFGKYREFLRGVYHDDPFLRPPKLKLDEQLRWLMNFHSVSISDIARELGVNEKTMHGRLFRHPGSPRIRKHMRDAVAAIRAIVSRRGGSVSAGGKNKNNSVDD